MPSGIYKRKPFTEEHKKRIGLKSIGRKSTLGKHYKLSEEAKINIGNGHRGEKNGNWKDGRTKNKEYRSWLKNRRNRMPKIGEHTFGEWELLKKQYGYVCPCCKRKEPEIKLTEDHIIPLSKGGSDYIENIQPLCQNCNSKKHTKIIKYDNNKSL